MGCSGCGPRRRKDDAELRATPRPALDLNAAPACCTMPYTIASPRPVPLPVCFGGVERLEQVLADIVGHASSAVADQELRIAARTQRAVLGAGRAINLDS